MENTMNKINGLDKNQLEYRISNLPTEAIVQVRYALNGVPVIDKTLMSKFGEANNDPFFNATAYRINKWNSGGSREVGFDDLNNLVLADKKNVLIYGQTLTQNNYVLNNSRKKPSIGQISEKYSFVKIFSEDMEDFVEIKYNSPLFKEIVAKTPVLFLA